jgi:hypothetical protein
VRIVDLVRPYEPGLERIVDETPAALGVRRHIFLPDGVEYVRAEDGASDAVGPGSLVLTVLGPDPKQHGDPAAASAVIGRLATGGRALILFGWRPADVPYHRLLDVLTAHRGEVLQVASIDGAGTIGAGAVIERVAELQPPRDALGEPTIEAPADDDERWAMTLRLTNEYVFGEYAGRVLRSVMLDSVKGVDQRRFDAYRAQAEQQIEQRDARIRKLDTQIAKYESSTALKLGRALVRGAKSPRAFVGLPIALIRIWRSRGS